MSPDRGDQDVPEETPTSDGKDLDGVREGVPVEGQPSTTPARSVQTFSATVNATPAKEEN